MQNACQRVLKLRKKVWLEWKLFGKNLNSANRY